MNGRTDLSNDNDLIRAFEQDGTDHMDIETIGRIVALAELGIATKLGGKFERVDFYRIAEAFDCTIEEVHKAVAMTGFLFRQRASPDPVVMPEIADMDGATQLKMMTAGIAPKTYEAMRTILKDAQP